LPWGVAGEEGAQPVAMAITIEVSKATAMLLDSPHKNKRRTGTLSSQLRMEKIEVDFLFWQTEYFNLIFGAGQFLATNGNLAIIAGNLSKR
jgi:hypothetical protein